MLNRICLRLLGHILRPLFAASSPPGLPAHTLPRGLGMYEPTTAITDFLLALLALWFAKRLWQQPRTVPQRTQRAWTGGFIASALAATAGGIFHGFGPDMPPWARTLLWKLTMLATGLTSFFLLLATVFASAPKKQQWLWLSLVTLKSVIYARWVVRENNFRFVVYDYASAMFIILAVQLRELRHRAAARWIALGIGASFLAAAIQQAGISLHTHFNKNDIFHVIQGIGLFMFYKGADKLDDHV